ncbi:hypothetical protein [Candidatus Coxiella mudrowiae]|uniref:hypothetical protein n=1 Tax=Candidatus Coxiella mudrowiae TaxID=2054173 RepID=UPI000C2915D0|nr:hypothetical protein [Candidatus Coxiella mudrowiae]
MPKSLIEIKDLSITFGLGKNRKTVVSDVDLTLQRGQCFGLVGELGSRKSLTALAIMQFLQLRRRSMFEVRFYGKVGIY